MGLESNVMHRRTVYLEFYEEGRGENPRIEHELSRKLLKKGLNELYGISREKELDFTKGEHGKPQLSHHPEIHFSISHCRGLVGCAFGERELGLDLERLRPFSARLADRLLSPKEQEHLKKAKEPESMFFRFWTLKECYGKAQGTGLAYPLHKAEFFPDEAESMAFEALGCQFYQKQLREEFFLAICMKQQKSSYLAWKPEKNENEWNFKIYGY